MLATVHIPLDWKVKSVRIGELATAASVPTKTIRYYEAIGLLPAPARQANGYRSYDAAVVDRLRFVKAAQAVGFSLDEIRDILSLRDRGQPPCEHVLALVDRHAQDIAERIAGLQRMQDDLRRLAAQAPAATEPGGYCHLIERPRP
jgi:DNA-binding transcriptional MerR regulator